MDEDEEGDALFEEEDGLILEPESDTPPHLRDLAASAEAGDVDALRHALGIYHILFLRLIFVYHFIPIRVLHEPTWAEHWIVPCLKPNELKK